MSLLGKPYASSSGSVTDPSAAVVSGRQDCCSSSTAQKRVADSELAVKPRLPRFPRRSIDIRSHGASEGAQALCTDAINAAIEACAARGGGRVVVPAGSWISGPIRLRSNVELRLSQGATLRFSPDPDHYLPAVPTRWCGYDCYAPSPFIYAHGCKNIAVTGEGVLAGDASGWAAARHQSKMREALEKMSAAALPVQERRLDGGDLLLPPPVIGLLQCSSVLLEGFSVSHPGPLATVQLANCQHLAVRDLILEVKANPASDGIVLDACQQVLVRDCQVSAGGDCLSISTGYRSFGSDDDQSSNIEVRGLRALAGQCGVSVQSRGCAIRDVVVNDCRIDNVTTGISLTAARGVAASLENLEVRQVSMGQIAGDAVRITGSGAHGVDADMPALRKVSIRSLTCTQASTAVRLAELFTGSAAEISLEDLTITADQGLYCTASNGLRLANVRITPRSGPVLSLKDSRNIIIDGLNSAHPYGVFLDLRGRQVRDVRLRGTPGARVRPVVVLGIDVPRDALIHD